MLNMLIENQDLIWPFLLSVVTLASVFVNGTRTPDPDTTIGKIYKIVEWAALNFGKSKDKGK